MGCVHSLPKTQEGSFSYAGTGFAPGSPAGVERASPGSPSRSHALDGLGARNAGASGDASPRVRCAELPASSSGGKATYVTRSGRQFLSSASLPSAERTAFLAANDPETKLGLKNESVFYRVTTHHRVADSMISGNPNSMAKIANHLALEESPYYARMRSFALKCSDRDEQAKMLQTLEGCNQYRPVSMYASDLPEHSLNVMFGTNAAEGVRGYLKEGKVVVKMTLGEIREAGGGLVFFDTKAARNNTGSIPLIVTLPAGAKVPVEIL